MAPHAWSGRVPRRGARHISAPTTTWPEFLGANHIGAALKHGSTESCAACEERGACARTATGLLHALH